MSPPRVYYCCTIFSLSNNYCCQDIPVLPAAVEVVTVCGTTAAVAAAAVAAAAVAAAAVAAAAVAAGLL